MHTWTIKESNKEFKTPQNWNEITISTFAQYQSLVRELQKDFVKVFGLKDETEINTITDVEILNVFPTYYIKIICFWSGLTRTEALKVHSKDFFAVYTALNAVLGKTLKDKETDSFEHKGETYLFPKNTKDINGNIALMGGEDFGTMIYMFQQEQNLNELNKGRFDVIANQMAISCRKKGEEFDPDKTNARAKLFQDLPMDVVWQWVFFSIRQTKKYKRTTKIYSVGEEGKAS